jgi:hypothetical protein
MRHRRRVESTQESQDPLLIFAGDVGECAHMQSDRVPLPPRAAGGIWSIVASDTLFGEHLRPESRIGDFPDCGFLRS